MSIPRPEYPRPQFERSDWINLNGIWTCVFDFGKSGMERGLASSRGFDREILVPFCPESRLSGIGHKDFIEMMWYHRIIKVPEGWKGKRVMLQLGGVDYECEIFIDGLSVGRHWGGSASFSFNITRFAEPGVEHNLVIHVRDETRSGIQPGGKQNFEYSYRKMRCHYTRTTGIWQTVWMEAVSPGGFRDCVLTPDVDGERLVLTPRFFSIRRSNIFHARIFEGNKVVAEGSFPALDGLPLSLGMENPILWEPDKPFLYDLVLEVLDREGNLLDSVKSYVGMRKVHIEGNTLYMNNEPIYLRMVLDQGFYPDGVWTAPQDVDLKRDIELSMAAGFNGARLHQKVFEERFHYWADRLGYMTWGESSSWGIDVNDMVGARNFLSEWREIVVRDRNHPSIIAWTPLNETGRIADDPRQHNRFHADLYELTHALDPTRPVNDASGYIHVRTDLWTVHNYTQDPEELKSILIPSSEGELYRSRPELEADYEGQPYIVDEFGGILWIPEGDRPFQDTSWGYGEAPKTEEEFYERLGGLVDAILSQDHICGFCYTQLTDVEQEQNGIYNFDRTKKLDTKRIAAIFRKPSRQ